MADLPKGLHEVLEEVPLIVEDEPGQKLRHELSLDDGSDLCGLHWGVPLTERSVGDVADRVDHMMLFRGPILRMTGFSLRRADEGIEELRRQIRITVLHEIGHHFGLDEDELEALGYA